MFAIDPPTAPTGMDPPAVVVAAADVRPSPVELSSFTVPRFDSVDGATHASRLDISLMPRRSSSIGLAMGVTSPGAANPRISPFAAAPTMDFGIHWRLTLDSSYRFDVTAYKRVPNADAMSMIESRDPGYGARLELGMGSIPGRSKGFVADRGFVGFQLEGGGRVTVKRKHGGPMFYYRNTF